MCCEIQSVLPLKNDIIMQQLSERKWVFLGLITLGLTFSIVAALTEIPAGGADNYAHFNISRWAFRYPHLFLDHWGKPVFTILTAPFAQFGLLAVRIFNIMAGLITAWFCYRLATHFKLKYSWFAVVITVFTPIYFVMMFSGMTEVLFSLVLVISIFLFYKKRYLSSAIMISFLFLIRNEGLAFIGLFLIALLIKKQFKSIPFLFTGFILFSLIGWVFYYHDFWWLINKRPYSIGGSVIYGSGGWYTFFKKMPLYFGPVVPFFLLAGTIVILVKWLHNETKFTSGSFTQVVLILGSFWGYLFVHNYLWWQGISSAGLVRVMAAVSPLVGIITVYALNSFANAIKSKNKIYAGTILILTVYMTGAAGDYYHRSLKRNVTTQVLNNATKYLIQPSVKKHQLVVHNPYFAYSTGRDAWNKEEIQYGFADKTSPGSNLSDSTLFVWDAHISPNEGNTPLERIMENPYFELVAVFEPQIPYVVLGGNYYQILIFRKTSGSGHDNYNILRNLKQKNKIKEICYVGECIFRNPFQHPEHDERGLAKEENESGFDFYLNCSAISPAFQLPAEVIEEGIGYKGQISTDVFFHKFNMNQLLIFISPEDINQVHYYATIDFIKQNLKYDVWNETDFNFCILQKLNKEFV